MTPAVSTSSAYCNECGSWQRDGHRCAARRLSTVEASGLARFIVADLLSTVEDEQAAGGLELIEAAFDREERRAAVLHAQRLVLITQLAQRRKGGR